MFRKNRYFVFEIASAAIVLVVLAVITVPHFLRQQTRAKPEQMLQAIKAVFDACEAYKADCQIYPPNFYPTDHEDYEFVSPLLFNLPIWKTDPFESLLREGYLNETPTIITDCIGHGLTPPYSFMLFTIGPHKERFKQEILNFGFVIRWPEASAKDDDAFDRVYPPNDLLRLQQRKRDILLPPQVFYAPSNGVDSAGYVFMDIQGNHSPVD